MKRIKANLVPPLDVWAGKAYLLDIAKNTRGLKRLHQYTGRSVEKRVYRTFHLAFYLIHLAGGIGIGVRKLVYW